MGDFLRMGEGISCKREVQQTFHDCLLHQVAILLNGEGKAFGGSRGNRI